MYITHCVLNKIHTIYTTYVSCWWIWINLVAMAALLCRLHNNSGTLIGSGEAQRLVLDQTLWTLLSYLTWELHGHLLSFLSDILYAFGYIICDTFLVILHLHTGCPRSLVHHVFINKSKSLHCRKKNKLLT